MPKLQYVKFLSGNCKIDMQDFFVSPRIIKEKIEKHFKLVTAEETALKQKYKIVRFGRLYGAPFLYPSATVSFTINKEENTVTCQFFWPEWYLLLFSIFGFGISVYHSLEEWANLKGAITDGVEFAIFSCMFINLAVFLDTKYVARKIRKLLINIV
jgi:hypothetical protein